MNNREKDDFVLERLDRAFASVEWVNTYPMYALKNHPIRRSLENVHWSNHKKISTSERSWED